MSDYICVPEKELRPLFLKLMEGRHVRKDVAAWVVNGLIETSLRGVDSHGIRLFPHYLNGVRGGRINPDPQYRCKQTGGATATFDGDHTFGHAAGSEAMHKAIAMARESGIGGVTVYNSSHFGAAACYSLLAARQGMIGLSFTHADALTLSSGGVRPYFGTNPIAFAAPVLHEEPFSLDMATSTTNWNKIRECRKKDLKVPLNWGANDQGEATADPNAMIQLFPIGDYKGFGLAMMIDILCGVLTGMPFARAISSMYKAPIEEKRFLGHFMMAIDISRFIPLAEFKQRMQQMIDSLRAEPKKDSMIAVQVPGDPEKKAHAKRSKEGIPIDREEWKEIESLAKGLQ